MDVPAAATRTMRQIGGNIRQTRERNAGQVNGAPADLSCMRGASHLFDRAWRLRTILYSLGWKFLIAGGPTNGASAPPNRSQRSLASEDRLSVDAPWALRSQAFASRRRGLEDTCAIGRFEFHARWDLERPAVRL